MVTKIDELKDELREQEDLTRYYQKEYDNLKENYSKLNDKLERISEFEKIIGTEIKKGFQEMSISYYSISIGIWLGCFTIACILIWGFL